FFSGENLFFISPISDNFDPEATSGAGASGKLYPIAKTLSLGLNLEF
ncbi:MAG: hypothetical protein GWN62_14150, partial [Aliifodinibius sp.]|nr:hypothetical protein [Fodinibius sp.]